MVDVMKLKMMAETAQDDYFYNVAMNEATFYGRNAELKKAEAILDDMVKIAHTKGTGTDAFNDKMMDLAEVLRRTFGFSSFQINNSILMLHPGLFGQVLGTAGCTLCHSAILKYSRMTFGNLNTTCVEFDRTHKGVKFEKGTQYGMRMFLGMGLFTDYGPELSMTGAEILAIILHEIGHNFYVGPVRELTFDVLGMLCAADIVSYFCGYIYGSILLEGIGVLDGMLPDNIQSTGSKIYNTLSGILQPLFGVTGIIGSIKSLIRIAIYFSLFVSTIPVRMVRAIFHYDSEKYSDAFATSYGYGTELSTALEKFDHIKIKGVTEKAGNGTQNVLDFLKFLYQFPIDILLYFIDEHPNSEGRLKNDIDFMEEAGKKITDPRLQKEFDIEMKKMYALRDEVKKYRGPNAVKLNAKIVSIIQDLANISDPKDVFSSLRPKWSKYKNIDM